MACQIHFWDALINRQIDDVIVMNHYYEVWFRKLSMIIFNIPTPSLFHTVIQRSKISFKKMFDFKRNSHMAYVSLIWFLKSRRIIQRKNILNPERSDIRRHRRISKVQESIRSKIEVYITIWSWWRSNYYIDWICFQLACWRWNRCRKAFIFFIELSRFSFEWNEILKSVNRLWSTPIRSFYHYGLWKYLQHQSIKTW